MGALKSRIVSRLPDPVTERLQAVKRALAQRHWVEETEIIAGLASTSKSTDLVLVDVGAHYGTVTNLFLELGWSVVAYEPDPNNRQHFQQTVGANSRVQLSTSAVSDTSAASASLFTSSTSTGISTLAAFHESHEPTATVGIVTLAEDLRARQVSNVEFLKIDIEGFDFFAMKGFDWTYTPRFVLYEFEDRKTVPLGYSLADSTSFAVDHGYHLVYSVWEPIVEYGTRHRWRGLFSAPPTDVAECWGNVLCFRDPADAVRCMEKFGPCLQRLVSRHGRSLR